MTDLFPEWRVGDVVLTEAPFAVQFGGTDYGAPENVTEVIRSMFLDGDFEVSSKAGNRTVVLPVLIEDADLAALAEAERLLELECAKVRNEVYVDPGDGFAEPFIFDVFRGQLVFAHDDKREQNGFRSYTLTFRALPYSRSVEAVTLTPTPTSVGTARQQGFTFEVVGSARTEAALHVGSSAALGNTLIYTRPGAQGMIPLRQYRTGGGSVTTDATTVSGGYEGIGTPFVAVVPKEDVPDGTYILVARLRTASGGRTSAVSSEVRTLVGGLSTQTVAMTASVSADLTADYQILLVGGRFGIPTEVVVSPGDAAVEITLEDSVGSVRFDEAWLVEIGSGALSWPTTDAVSGGAPAAEHVWVEPPTAAHPAGLLLRGTEADQSDAFGVVQAKAWGRHVLEPGENHAFVVTDGTTAAVLDGSWCLRWHTHAGS